MASSFLLNGLNLDLKYFTLSKNWCKIYDWFFDVQEIAFFEAAIKTVLEVYQLVCPNKTRAAQEIVRSFESKTVEAKTENVALGEKENVPATEKPSPRIKSVHPVNTEQL